MALFRRLPDPDKLDRILAVAQARGVAKLVIGEFQLELHERPSQPLSERLEGAARLLASPKSADAGGGDRPPSDDELLYGQDGYGLGAGAEGS